VNFSPESTSGTLSVAGLNQECGSGPPSTLSVIFHPPPQVSLAANDSVCFNEAPFLLNGGTPAGGQYSIDGNVSPVFDPGLAGAGEHQLVYNYTDQYGCSSADTMPVFVRVGHECDILIWVPNAFSPNGDGVNDFFKPVYRNLRQFSMNIFSRNGAIVFSSSNPAKGWDGMFSGNEAPAENYAYIIVYQSSFSPPENTTLTGTVCLVR
jgi:gliding motility-associated-like protein